MAGQIDDGHQRLVRFFLENAKHLDIPVYGAGLSFAAVDIDVGLRLADLHPERPESGVVRNRLHGRLHQGFAETLLVRPVAASFFRCAAAVAGRGMRMRAMHKNPVER